jgi:hypothetical protein
MQHLIKSELRRRKEERHLDYYGKWVERAIAMTARNKPRPVVQDEIEYPNENELFCFELKNRNQ